MFGDPLCLIAWLYVGMNGTPQRSIGWNPETPMALAFTVSTLHRRSSADLTCRHRWKMRSSSFAPSFHA